MSKLNLYVFAYGKFLSIPPFSNVRALAFRAKTEAKKKFAEGEMISDHNSPPPPE
jgi:hypothetical protein